MFGSWFDNDIAIDRTKNVRHVAIPEFFDEETFNAIVADIPRDDAEFEHHYSNPIEEKLVISSLDRTPVIQSVFESMADPAFIQKMERITGISGLEYDTHTHGGGVHRFSTDGKLDLHLDYSKHPRLEKERRLNLIVFASPSWKRAWGGALELWDANCAALETSVEAVPNTAVLFEVDNTSWHGVPRAVTAPPGHTRDSIACYFVSNPTSSIDRERTKAFFVPHPDDRPVSAAVQRLYDIRAKRLLTADDVATYTRGAPIS
jgi:Rps23 Pro-64 3,4-dihydroxylase Tpa1-like proline 4-hydroxylase